MPSYMHYYIHSVPGTGTEMLKPRHWDAGAQYQHDLSDARKGLHINCRSSGVARMHPLELAVLDVKCSQAKPGEKITFTNPDGTWTHWFEELPDATS